MKPSGKSLPFYASIVALIVILAVGFAKCDKDRISVSPSIPAPVPAPTAAIEISPVPAVITPSSGVRAAPPAPVVPTEVAIQNDTTIDFSSGKAVVRDTAREKEIIDLAVKEMDAAASNFTFGPTPPTAVSPPSPTPATTPHD